MPFVTSGHASLTRWIAEVASHPEPASLLVVLRIRKLAAIDEVLGPSAVADLLAQVETTLKTFDGGDARVARIDEATFGLLRRGSIAEAEDMAQRLVAAAGRGVGRGDAMYYAPANAGVCAVQAGVDAGVQLERALGALQRAMSRGAGFVEVVSAMRAAQEVDEWETRMLLEEAALRGELHLEYQTIQSPAGGTVRKVEALLRWINPKLGSVRPDVFIPMLEESGAIRPVGEWVLREAARQVGRWREQTGQDVRAAINLSPVQLMATDFVRTAERALAEGGCDASCLELEITEGAIIRNFSAVRAQLEALAAHGFSLAIDDFGAGYSSLGQLVQLPVHHLKMDRSLIAGLPDGNKRADVVKAVVALAEALGLAVTAEGVERTEQAQWLQRFAGMQCQGYLFSRPMRADRVAELLVEGVAAPPA